VPEQSSYIVYAQTSHDWLYAPIGVAGLIIIFKRVCTPDLRVIFYLTKPVMPNRNVSLNQKSCHYHNVGRALNDLLCSQQTKI